MPKLFVIDKFWKKVEIDLKNPEPILRTHCAICFNPLFPEWIDKNGTREISEKALCAICHRCSSYGPDKRLKIKTVDQLKEERQRENKERAKQRRRAYIPKKIKDKAVKRGEAMNVRPCGCSIKGRHKATCKLAAGYKKRNHKNE